MNPAAPPDVRRAEERQEGGALGRAIMPLEPPMSTIRKGPREERLLRIAFGVGALTDAVALLPMLIPALAKLLWGVGETPAIYRFAMSYGASLMLGWTILLCWAYRRPLERRIVAVMTIVVVLGLVLAELSAVEVGALVASRLIPTWILQALLLALFALAFYRSSELARRSNQ